MSESLKRASSGDGVFDNVKSEEGDHNSPAELGDAKVCIAIAKWRANETIEREKREHMGRSAYKQMRHFLSDVQNHELYISPMNRHWNNVYEDFMSLKGNILAQYYSQLHNNPDFLSELDPYSILEQVQEEVQTLIAVLKKQKNLNS